MSKKMYFLISFVVLLSLVTSASAYDTVIWDNDGGGGDRTWDTAVNWDKVAGGPDKVPEASDWAVIQDYADANSGPIVNADTNAVARWIDLGYTAPVYPEAVLTIEGGTVTCTETLALGYYQPGNYR
jgi:hypothetical protein